MARPNAVPSYHPRPNGLRLRGWSPAAAQSRLPPPTSGSPTSHEQKWYQKPARQLQQYCSELQVDTSMHLTLRTNTTRAVMAAIMEVTVSEGIHAMPREIKKVHHLNAKHVKGTSPPLLLLARVKNESDQIPCFSSTSQTKSSPPRQRVKPNPLVLLAKVKNFTCRG